MPQVCGGPSLPSPLMTKYDGWKALCCKDLAFTTCVIWHKWFKFLVCKVGIINGVCPAPPLQLPSTRCGSHEKTDCQVSCTFSSPLPWELPLSPRMGVVSCGMVRGMTLCVIGQWSRLSPSQASMITGRCLLTHPRGTWPSAWQLCLSWHSFCSWAEIYPYNFQK